MNDPRGYIPGEDEPPERVLRRIGKAGWVLCFLLACFLAACGYLQPEPYAGAWRLVLELALMGPLVSVSDGIASGFSRGHLLIQNIVQDIVLTLVLYPWIIRGYRHRFRSNFVGRRIEQVRAVAERHRSTIQPFGALGLWVFVFFPFWSTGPLVGAAVGYLIGLRTYVALASVFLGHAISVAALVVFFDVVHDTAASFSRGLAAYIPWIVAGILLTTALITRLFRRRNESQLRRGRLSPR